MAAMANPNKVAELVGDQVQHTRTRVGTCYAGAHIDNNGTEYAVAADGTLQGTSLGTWNVAGNAADKYVRCTLNSGTLDAGSDATGVWLQCNVDRSFYVVDTTSGNGPVTADFDLEIAGGSGGTPLYATATNYTPSAEDVV